MCSARVPDALTEAVGRSTSGSPVQRGSPRAGSGRAPAAARRRGRRQGRASRWRAASKDRSTTRAISSRVARSRAKRSESVGVRRVTHRRRTKARRTASGRAAAQPARVRRTAERRRLGAGVYAMAARRSSTWANARIRLSSCSSSAEPGGVGRPASRRSRVQSDCRAAGCRTARARTRRGTCGRSWSPYARSSATICCQRLAICERMFSSTNVWACRSRTIWQPDGRNGKPSLDLALEPASVSPVRARSLMVEAELLAVVADEVQHGQHRLVAASVAVRDPAAEERSWRSRSAGGTAPCRRRAGRGPR